MKEAGVAEEVRNIAADIQSMRIRGAGEIARSAARGMAIAARGSTAASSEELIQDLKDAARTLVETRPSAVSLPNAVRLILHGALSAASGGAEEIRKEVVEGAERFITESKEATRLIGEIGSARIVSGSTIMTHCHSMAVVEILKTAHRQGKDIQVIAREARPRYQGRITAKALAEEGIPTTLIVDSAARFFMKDVDQILVGADSVAANGAVVNKIGTSALALLAHEARVRVMVATETYKFHPETIVGQLIEIEERTAWEVLPEGIPGVNVRNPAFDVTPPELIDLIVTERGIIPPQAAVLVLRDLGWSMWEKEPWE